MGSPYCLLPVTICLPSRGPGPLLTIAQHGHILVVKAVVDTPAPAATLAQRHLLPTAFHVVQQDGAPALAKGKGSWHRQCQATAQLTTHHIGVHHVPVIVTYAAPGATVQDFQASSAAAGAPYQPQLCKEGGADTRGPYMSAHRMPGEP